ncbi:MAG: FdhD protein [Pseudohongiellaceae bacterium]|jgi:FdhD protein
MSESPAQRELRSWANSTLEPPRADDLAVEEPLEVRLGSRSLLVTMRTPGNDGDLVRGLMFTEGLVASASDVVAVQACRDVPETARGNVVVVSLAQGAVLDELRTPRVGLMASSCGVCGKASLEAIRSVAPVVAPGPTISGELVLGLMAELRGQQPLFERTGGLHAAGLFDSSGRLLAAAEDIGRHNAVDKVIGQAIRFGALPLSDCLLVISGRAGFEIIQKARKAGIPVICSVSAPSSLAVDLAVDGEQTLVGFLRDDRFNVYAGAERFAEPSGG